LTQRPMADAGCGVARKRSMATLACLSLLSTLTGSRSFSRAIQLHSKLDATAIVAGVVELEAGSGWCKTRAWRLVPRFPSAAAVHSHPARLAVGVVPLTI
jgi:hypothetical protein